MKRSRKKKKNQEEFSRKRAETIINVRSGQITATEGARQLGISRKSYYRWEHRGLEGLMTALEESPPGRPEEEIDPEKEALKKKVHQMERELLLEKQANEVKTAFLRLELEKAKAEEAEKHSKKKKRR